MVIPGNRRYLPFQDSHLDMPPRKSDDDLFTIFRASLFTSVVGDLMDKMGMLRQFLPAAIRPLRVFLRFPLLATRRLHHRQHPVDGWRARCPDAGWKSHMIRALPGHASPCQFMIIHPSSTFPRRRLSALVGLFLLLPTTMNGQSTWPRPVVIPLPASVAGVAESRIPLNGTWKFTMTPPSQFWKTTASAATWSDIAVPGEPWMQGHSIDFDVEYPYKKQIDIPADFAEKKSIPALRRCLQPRTGLGERSFCRRA